jgi:hypothetical protein
MKSVIEVLVLGRPPFACIATWSFIWGLIGLGLGAFILASLHCAAMHYSSTYENWVLASIAPYYKTEDDDVSRYLP